MGQISENDHKIAQTLLWLKDKSEISHISFTFPMTVFQPGSPVSQCLEFTRLGNALEKFYILVHRIKDGSSK
jgi:hypothetical protein